MPARRYCCVVDCKNSEQNSPQLTFYRFPGRNYQIDQKNRWIQAVRRTTCDGESPWQPNKNTRICSSHFIGDLAPVFTNSNLSGVPKTLLQLLKKQEEAQGVLHDIQEKETSGPSFNIKEEIDIEESVLEEYDIPKLEVIENTSVDTTDDVDPLSLSCVDIQTSQETVSRSTLQKSTVVSSNIAEKSHNENESANFVNIIPKLESFENASEDTVRVQENVVQNQPVQETTTLLSTLKDNTNFSPSSSKTSHNKKRKISDQDSRVEDRDILNIVQVKSENREDYLDYAMYIAARLKNSNQSDNAIAIAKKEIELILCDLDQGIYNLRI